MYCVIRVNIDLRIGRVVCRGLRPHEAAWIVAARNYESTKFMDSEEYIQIQNELPSPFNTKPSEIIYVMSKENRDDIQSVIQQCFQ